ncbi:DNA cross-link repair 1A protein [Conglomerata obtusa]
MNDESINNIYNNIKTSEFDDQPMDNKPEHFFDRITTQSTIKQEKYDIKDCNEFYNNNYKGIANTKRTIFNSVDKNNVFNRCTIKQSNNQIELISMMHTNKFKIQEICKKYKEDRICVIIGSGWNNKTVYYDHIKENGSFMKNGIELIYLPYSEHSSNEELINFRNKMKYHKIINTVKNTWAHE